MKWFEYQMEVDQLKAPEDLKARLLAMEPKPDQSPKGKETKKARAIPFPHWKRWAAAAAACVAVAFVGSQVLQTGGLAVGGAGAASSAALASVPQTASLYAAQDNSLEAGAATRSAAGSSSTSVAGDKILYTASLTLETRDYDAARSGLEQALADAGGWMESSSESSDSGESRTLSLTLRVPEENYQSFLTAAGQTGSLVNRSEYADDVTASYTDVEGRIANLEGQRDRLRELQASAENLSDLLDIEAQLSDVQYQLESWQSQLDWYDDQIASCTVTVTLREVDFPAGSGFVSRLASAFGQGWENFVGGLAAIAVVLAGLWPVVVLVILAIAVVAAVRRRRR